MRKQKSQPAGRQGFTLIEILVVVTIIAILTAIGIVSYSSINKRSRDAKRKSDIEQMRSALEMYRAENGYYVDAGSGVFTEASNLAGALVSTYLPAIPSDPKTGVSYWYKATDVSGVKYYGYCLSANLESENPPDTCTPYTAYNYGVKNP